MQGNIHHTMHNAIMDAVSIDTHIHQHHIGQHIQSLRINRRGIHIRISVNHKGKEQHNQIAHIHIIIEGVVTLDRRQRSCHIVRREMIKRKRRLGMGQVRDMGMIRERKDIRMMIVRMIAIGMRMVRVGSRHRHRTGHIVRGSSERKSDVTE